LCGAVQFATVPVRPACRGCLISLIELARDARRTLRILRDAKLNERAWRAVDVPLRRLEEAVRAGDASRLDAAIADLELFGPQRVATRVHTDAGQVPPESVRTYIDQLVHELDRLARDVDG
jgi:CATRA-Associated Small Protein